MLAYNLYICSTTFQNYYKLTAALMREDLIRAIACWREVFVLERIATVSADKSSYSQISKSFQVITIPGIWQVARSYFNSSKTSNQAISGIMSIKIAIGCFLSKRSQFFSFVGGRDRCTMNLCQQVFQQMPKNYLHPPHSKHLLLNPALTIENLHSPAVLHLS